MPARGNSRLQDGCESPDDSFRRILSLRPHKMFCTRCIDIFALCSSSEALNFGGGYICNAGRCRETCRDEPFFTMRPLSTEADADYEHDGTVPVTGITRTLEPGVCGPLPGCWSRDGFFKRSEH